MKISFARCLLLSLCWLGFSANAAQLGVDDSVPTLSAQDQHGQNFTLTKDVHFLLVATEMACAKSANHVLAAQGTGFLEKHHAAYLMDIHTMPAVARFFALPKMRKYPQRIVLVETAATLAAFPTQPGRITVLALTPAGRILKISYWNPDSDPTAKCFE
jgi:hypothetical protein